MTDKPSGVIAPEAEVPALNIIGEVRVLHLDNPTDVVVINVVHDISQEQMMRVREMWIQTTKLPNPVICLINGVDVKVMKLKKEGIISG